MAVETPTASPESSVAAAEPITSSPEAGGGATQGTTEAQLDRTQATDTKPADEKLSVMGVEIEKAKVPPELLEKVDQWNKSYTEKSQKLSEAEKKAQALDQLANDADFVKWYADRLRGSKTEEKPKEDEYNLTPEHQAELLSDPKKMREYIEGLATSVVNRYAMPAAQQAQMEARTLRNEQQIALLENKHPDFKDLNDQGKIEEVVARYYKQSGMDIDLEDAYWLAKRPFMESEADLKAHQRVREKVNGTTLAPSGAPQSGIKMVSGKGLSFEEKMRVAAEHAFRGERIKFDS